MAEFDHDLGDEAKSLIFLELPKCNKIIVVIGSYMCISYNQ